MKVNEIIKQFNINVINRQVANELLDPSLHEFSLKQLSQILKFISIKKLKQFTKNNSIKTVYNAMLHSGEISSLRCLKYIINEYSCLYPVNKFVSDILYFLLKAHKTKYINFILKRYYENINYLYLLKLFSEERNERCIFFLRSKFLYKLTDENYKEMIKYCSSKCRLSERLENCLRLKKLDEIVNVEPVNEIKPIKTEKEFNLQEIILSLIAVILAFQMITLVVISLK